MRRLEEHTLGLIIVVGAYTVGLVGIAGAAEPGVAEGSAVLAAPLATFGGAKIGHGSGPQAGFSRFDGWLAAFSVGAAVAAALLMIDDSERRTASISLIVAALGIGLAHVWHHWLSSEASSESLRHTDEIFGWSLLGGASLVGLAWIWWDRDNAEMVATIAAAGVTVGGTFLGHARGRRTALTTHARSRPPAGSPAATPAGTDISPPAPH